MPALCPGPLRLLQQNTTVGLAYKQQKFISHSSESRRIPRPDSPAWSASAEGLCSGSQAASPFILYVLTGGWGGRVIVWGLWSTNTICKGSVLTINPFSEVFPLPANVLRIRNRTDTAIQPMYFHLEKPSYRASAELLHGTFPGTFTFCRNTKWKQYFFHPDRISSLSPEKQSSWLSCSPLGS